MFHIDKQYTVVNVCNTLDHFDIQLLPFNSKLCGPNIIGRSGHSVVPDVGVLLSTLNFFGCVERFFMLFGLK